MYNAFVFYQSYNILIFAPSLFFVLLSRVRNKNSSQHLDGLAKLISNDDIADELYQRVDVPLKVGEDSEAGDAGRKVSVGDSIVSFYPPIM